MISKDKHKQIFRFIVFVITINLFFNILLSSSFATNKEFCGLYEYRRLVAGYWMEDTVQNYRLETSDTISTFFGSYDIVIISKHSNIKLEHSKKGYIEILDDTGYYDQNHHLIKSESYWKIRLEGYYREEHTITYEYGNYVTLTDTPTIFEETYTTRFYIDGDLEEVISCRDYSVYETQEMVSIEAGDYFCDRIRTDFYENSVFKGYMTLWFDIKDGFLIKEMVYGTSSNLQLSFILISKTKPVYAWEIATWVLGALGAVIGTYAIYTKKKSRIRENVIKSNGKIKPNIYSPISKGGTDESSKAERSDYRISPSSFDPRIISLIKDPQLIEKEPEKFLVEETQSPKLFCPLCLGAGLVREPSGWVPCPLCGKKKT